MSPRNKYLCSDTYLHDPRYLELHGRCRAVHRVPGADPNHFAQTEEEIVGLGFLTKSEYDEMVAIARDWFDKEIQRLEAMGWQAQADSVRQYMEGKL